MSRSRSTTPSRLQALLALVAASFVLLFNLKDAFVAGPIISAEPTLGATAVASPAVGTAASARYAESRASSLLGLAAPAALLCLAASSLRRKPAKSYNFRVQAVPCKALAAPSFAAPAIPQISGPKIQEAAPTVSTPVAAAEEIPQTDLIDLTMHEAPAVMAATTPTVAPSAGRSCMPKAARFVGSARKTRQRHTARMAFGTSGRSARRSVGQRLQARANLEVVAPSFEVSRICREIQIGLCVSSKPRTEKGHESSLIRALDALDVSSGLHVQEVNPPRAQFSWATANNQNGLRKVS